MPDAPHGTNGNSIVPASSNVLERFAPCRPILAYASFNKKPTIMMDIDATPAVNTKMALAIIVCNAFLNAGLPTFTSDYADWTKALMYMCELTFSVAMTVGAVKGAQGLTSKALGL